MFRVLEHKGQCRRSSLGYSEGKDTWYKDKRGLKASRLNLGTQGGRKGSTESKTLPKLLR